MKRLIFTPHSEWLFGRVVFALLIFSGIFLFSCRTPYKSTEYFRTLPHDTLIKVTYPGFPESKIKAGDNLSILISSLNKEEDMIFNAAGGQVVPVYTGSANENLAYGVDKAGNIELHQLGKVKAEGLTRKQLQDKLQKDLLPYLKDPVVSVSFLNYRVTVMGDVKSPQVISIPQERITVLEALALSGDMNLTARRDNLMIIRDQDSGRYMKRINLEDNSSVNSPWYYLNHNDILYVASDDKKRWEDDKRSRFIQNFSIVLSSLSFLIIILDRLLN